MQQAVHFGAKLPLNRTLRRHFANSGIEGSLVHGGAELILLLIASKASSYEITQVI